MHSSSSHQMINQFSWWISISFGIYYSLRSARQQQKINYTNNIESYHSHTARRRKEQRSSSVNVDWLTSSISIVLIDVSNVCLIHVIWPVFSRLVFVLPIHYFARWFHWKTTIVLVHIMIQSPSFFYFRSRKPKRIFAMSFQWTFLATFLYVELFVVIILLLPFIPPSMYVLIPRWSIMQRVFVWPCCFSWDKFFKSRLARAFNAGAKYYFNFIICVFGLLFAGKIFPRPLWHRAVDLLFL